MRATVLILATMLAVGAGGCGDSPTEPAEPRGGVLATFDVSGERFAVFVTNPTTISQLFALRQGSGAANIPNGRVRRGPGIGNHNAPFDWHLDPEDIHMAEVAIEVCDGRPSHVQQNLGEFIDGIGRYCPWNARLVNLRDFR